MRGDGPVDQMVRRVTRIGGHRERNKCTVFHGCRPCYDGVCVCVCRQAVIDSVIDSTHAARTHLTHSRLDLQHIHLPRRRMSMSFTCSQAVSTCTGRRPSSISKSSGVHSAANEYVNSRHAGIERAGGQGGARAGERCVR